MKNTNTIAQSRIRKIGRGLLVEQFQLDKVYIGIEINEIISKFSNEILTIPQTTHIFRELFITNETTVYLNKQRKAAYKIIRRKL